MSASDPSDARKPLRLGLYGPFVALAVALVAWTVYWQMLKGGVERGLDAARRQGRIDWAARHVHGYPFRMDVDFDDLTLADGSGWQVRTPLLQTEAYAYLPGRWLLVLPRGLTLTRPAGGAVQASARLLRASVSGFARRPWRISIEGENLAFTPAPGAAPFFLSAADSFDFHTLAGPQDQGAVYIGFGGARAALTGLMGRIAEGRPVSLTVDGIYSHASALAGANWPSAVRAWTAAGGSLQARQITLAAGEALLDARAGRLTVDARGRLQGGLSAALREAPTATAPNAAPAPPAAQVALTFQDGRTRLGPADAGPAPKVF